MIDLVVSLGLFLVVSHVRSLQKLVKAHPFADLERQYCQECLALKTSPRPVTYIREQLSSRSHEIVSQRDEGAVGVISAHDVYVPIVDPLPSRICLVCQLLRILDISSPRVNGRAVNGKAAPDESPQECLRSMCLTLHKVDHVLGTFPPIVGLILSHVSENCFGHIGSFILASRVERASDHQIDCSANQKERHSNIPRSQPMSARVRARLVAGNMFCF